MPTIISHGIAAVAIGSLFQRTQLPMRFWAAGIACAVVPDLDVVGFRAGIPYGAAWGHRGLSHSLLFAIALGALVTFALFPSGLPGMNRSRIWLYLSLAAASHGVLDAFTNGGLGVAFLAPMDSARYFFPWRPIEVSPLGVGALLSREGASIFLSEAKWVWGPSALLVLASRVWRRSIGKLSK